MSIKQPLEERLKKTVAAMRRTEPDSGIDLCHITAVEEAIARLAKFAAFADEKGEPRKVLGTLPVTADGCILGDWARPYVIVATGAIKRGTTRTITYAWTPTTPNRHENRPHDGSLCYSTHESVTSALAAAKEQP